MTQTKQENPLISIVVITYNSSKYILETLESTIVQTYQNIELIVSDDCSTDNTVIICRKWIEENKERFVNTKFITAEHNTGITANVNRGLLSSKGEWIKFISGDDVLLNNCLQRNYDYTIQEPTANFIFSRIVFFGENNDNFGAKLSYINYDIFSYSAKQQYSYLVSKSNVIPAASAFLNKELLLQLGGFDERIKLMEDYPLWIKATKKGNKLYFLDEHTVKYRMHDNAISQTNPSKAYYKSQYLVFIYYNLKFLIIRNPFRALDHFIVLKSKYVFSKIISLFYVLLRFISPYAYYKFFTILFSVNSKK